MEGVQTRGTYFVSHPLITPLTGWNVCDCFPWHITLCYLYGGSINFVNVGLDCDYFIAGLWCLVEGLW